MPPYLPELLCPAGSEEALRAAVDSGANAVYLGYKDFGARASAVNFDDEALERAVRYAHLHHTRIYVTVNTLVKPEELDGVRKTLSVIRAAGADSAIVQDLGVASVVRREFPSLQLHASTQMAICNAQGVQWAKDMGFNRVVLARECGMEDIRKACQVGIEVEVFGHGALCTAVSGRCLMSSMSGGRSGNRGRCSQPCRQQLRMDDLEGPLLSLRDLCLLDDLPALCEAGAASLKIEGRLKSPEYVAVVTSVYRRALDGIARGDFRPGDLREKEKLLQIYNRGGFTRGHAMGAEDAQMVTPERVSHEGLPIGQIISVRRDLATMRVDRDLSDGDSLQLRGGKDEDMRYSGHDVPAGGTATLRLRPGLHAAPGMKVARLSDARQLEEARAHQPDRIPVSMVARFALGEEMVLSITDGETSVTANGPVVEAAQKRASTVDDARKQLEKLGETPFVLANPVQVIMDEGVFLPVSALNALRRDAASLLEEARIRAFALPDRQIGDIPAAVHPVDESLSDESLAVIFSDISTAEHLREAGATMLIFSPRIFTADALKQALAVADTPVWLRLPPQMTQETFESILPVIRTFSSRLAGIAAEGAWQLDLPIDLPFFAGEGIPVTNPESLALLEPKGISGFMLWPEWNRTEQKTLLPVHLPRLLKVYGREMLMLLNHCPERVHLGLSARRSECRICKNMDMVCGREDAAMVDRKGYRFPLSRTVFSEGCEIQVLGALPTDLRAYDADRRALEAGMLLHFTTETAEEQMLLTKQFAALLRGETILSAAGSTTSGHWLRGVE